MLRIVLGVSLLTLLGAGCGGSSRPDQVGARGVPRVLASAWAARASAVADAAASGNDCRAQQLASSLRDEIIADEARLPPRLYSPLLSSVNALADRIVCEVPPETVTVPAPKGPPKPKPPDKHHHHHGDQHGDQG
jgi:hypothetical protein